MDENMNGVHISSNDLSQIIQLITTLYNSSNPEDQNEANRQLTELQAKDEAWQVCWLLLDPDQNYPNEVHFFAANSLALKINQSWSKHNQEWLENELRPKLFESLVKYSGSPNGTKLVIDRLALALANFALHSIPTFWPDAIEDILKTFTNTTLPVTISSDRVRDILLRILTFLAEEYSVMLPQQEHRAKLNERISKSGPLVFKFLYALLMDFNGLSQSPDSKQNIFKCLTSWTLHSQTTLLELEEVRPLLDRLYEFIPDEELCAGACSTIAASFSSPKAENYRNAIIDFIPKIAALSGPIHQYLSEDELDCAVKIYSLVINFSENHCRLLLRVLLNDGVPLETQQATIIKQAILDIIKIILECTAVEGTFGHDEHYSDIAFPFWFSFFENFYYYSDSYTDTICDIFDPLVDSLFSTLIRKAQYPDVTVYQQTWDDDKRESFRCYRQDMGDNISLLAQFPRAKERLLRQLYEPLVFEMSQVKQSTTNNPLMVNGDQSATVVGSWQKIEAIMFALKSMSESIPFDEQNYVPKVFDLLHELPYSDSPHELYCTVAEMISAVSDWLYTHTKHLATAFTILFMGVSSPVSQVRLMSTLALKDLTSECQMELKPYWAQIVKSCTDAILQHGHILSTNEKSRLMHTIGTTLAITPAEYATNLMNTLTVPIVCELDLKSQVDPTTDPTCRPVILDRLTMLTNLIESLYIKESSGCDYDEYDENDIRQFDIPPQEAEAKQPALGLLKQLLPILMKITTLYRSDEEVMDKIACTVKRSARSLGIELKPVLNDLVSLMVNAYDPIANCSILDSLVPLFFVFKVDKSIRSFLRGAFARICDKTLEVCLANSLRQLSSTVEKFFDFATSIFKKYPDFLTDHPTPINIEYIYKLAIASLELPEKRTLTNVCFFLTKFRQSSAGVEHLHSIFVNHLDQLLTNVFNIFGANYNTPRNAVDVVIEMLYFVTDAPEVKMSLERIVEQENFPTCHVDRDQKARFASRLMQERSRNKYKICCSEFVMAARNLRRAM